MRILQGIILQLEVEIIMQIIGKHSKGLQDFQSHLDPKIISVLKGWMHSRNWLPLSVCCLILLIYKQLKLSAFFSMLVQAVYDLLCHRIRMRFSSSSSAHGPLETDDLFLLLDWWGLMGHVFPDMWRKMFCMSFSSDIHTVHACLKFTL